MSPPPRIARPLLVLALLTASSAPGRAIAAQGDYAEPPSHPRRPHSEPWPVALRFGAGAGVAFRASDATSPTFILGAAFQYKYASIGVEGRSDLPAVQDTSAGRIESSLALVTALPCIHRRALFLCALASFGSLRAQALDGLAPARVTRFYAEAGGRFGIEGAIVKPLGFRLHADIAGRVTHADVAIGGAALRACTICPTLGLSTLVTF